MHSKLKPATYSNFIPATVPIEAGHFLGLNLGRFGCLVRVRLKVKQAMNPVVTWIAVFAGSPR